MSLFPDRLPCLSAYQVRLEHTPVVVQHRLKSGVLHSQLQRSKSLHLARGVQHRSVSLDQLGRHCMSLFPDRTPMSGVLQSQLLQSMSLYLVQQVRHSLQSLDHRMSLFPDLLPGAL